MGSLTRYFYSKEDFVKNVTEDCDNYKLIDKSVKSNVIFALFQHKAKGNKIIYIIKYSKNKDGEFTYSHFTEHSGPFLYDCPEKILKQSEQSNEISKKWVAKCREIREKKKNAKKFAETLQYGQTVTMENNEVVIVKESNVKKTTFDGEDKNGELWLYSIFHIKQ